MNCKICGSENVSIGYHGIIRNGALGCYTSDEKDLYRCDRCGVIWHDNFLEDIQRYYVSEEYRTSMNETYDIQDFYRLHDGECMDKFEYTGTTIFRNKVVADVGCGGGAFLDFLAGVADKIVAIEPTENYRMEMAKKGYFVYPYMEEAEKDFRNEINVITSFDVIEHVEAPSQFMENVFKLLCDGGQAIIGTPTDAPVMRRLLGSIYESKQLFSTQHLWVFSENSLVMLAEQAGFKKVEVKFFQRYGIGNMLGWLRDKNPRCDIKEDFISDSLNEIWKAQCREQGMADYIVLYVEK